MFLEHSKFICPVCRQRLFKVNNTVKCLSNHSFDIAKQGYINLLMANSSGKRHGDDSLMVRARKSFLDKGYYAPLREAVSEILGLGHTVLDSGCGEGYYTARFAENNSVCGIDISKDALRLAARRCEDCEFAVASIADIPLPDGSVDAITNIFAPDSPDEFVRVLKEGGRLITVYPMENHLMELKAAVYDKPYLNPPVELSHKGMTLKSTKEVKYIVTLDCNEDIVSLFKMTPYYYKTSKTDQQKLESLDTLTVGLEFLIAEYVK